MMWRRGQVTAEVDRWGNAAVFEVRLENDDVRPASHDDASPATPRRPGRAAFAGAERPMQPARTVRALAYLPQVGEPQPGDTVLISANALERGLGTGGLAMIVAVPDRLPADTSGPGHVVKARYTPSQVMVLGVDEQESEHHALLQDADSIAGMPVIGADLHSALPAIVAGIHAAQTGARIAYVMADGGALPAWFSKLAYTLHQGGHILGTISAGQCYGGELEAVNVHTALLSARLVWNADIAIVAQGPGNLGTDTKWGFSGTGIGEALNAAGTLGGRPIACLRASSGDKRDRHLGISHHSCTVLSRVLRVPAAVVVPELAPFEELRARIEEQLRHLASNPLLEMVSVPTDAFEAALHNPPAPLRTMGRTLDQDRLSFHAAAAAGYYAGTLLD